MALTPAETRPLPATGPQPRDRREHAVNWSRRRRRHQARARHCHYARRGYLLAGTRWREPSHACDAPAKKLSAVSLPTSANEEVLLEYQYQCRLGELIRLVSFEMVDEALTQTGRVQERVRVLPSQLMVYLLLAVCPFPGLGWRQVWQRLTAGLDGLMVAGPTGGALAQARRWLGAEPPRWLFDLLRGPATGIGTAGVWWRGLLVCAIDGTTVAVPTARQIWPGSPSTAATTVVRDIRSRGCWGLVSCGTRTVSPRRSDRPPTVGRCIRRA
ncbi:transposase domain-containing protein [Streptomyces sp. NPDC047042]|uniref:transposase domain-containing protein n=1 Tax=Streptomyces sp. NPDC047042 TaxID=3154807 RepID=UPI0033C93856